MGEIIEFPDYPAILAKGVGTSEGFENDPAGEIADFLNTAIEKYGVTVVCADAMNLVADMLRQCDDCGFKLEAIESFKQSVLSEVE